MSAKAMLAEPDAERFCAAAPGCRSRHPSRKQLDLYQISKPDEDVDRGCKVPFYNFVNYYQL